MKRILLIFLAFVLLAVPSAAAHTATLFVSVAFKAPDHLTVRFLDPYGTPIEGAELEAIVTPAGGKELNPVKLTEGPAGTYVGKLQTNGAPAVTVRVETIQLDDLFRASVEIDTTKDLPERQIQMEQILLTTKTGFTWDKAIFVIEAVLFVIAVVAGLVWKPKPKPQQ